jgi:UDP-glucose 4-epimerase
VGPNGGSERFYVTGTSGALGAWAVKLLLDQGAAVVVNDDDTELRLIAGPGLDRVSRAADLDSALDRVTHVVHTNTLGEQACLADPSGTAEQAIGQFAELAAAAANRGVTGLAFESSMLVFAPSEVPVSADVDPSPTTLRGTYHVAQEIIARRAFCERGLGSTGLRTGLVFGPGQSRELDGGASGAIAAAVEDSPCALDYAGVADFQFVGDLAATLIAAARATSGSHRIGQLQGDRSTMAEFGRVVALATGTEPLTPGTCEVPYPLSAAAERLPTLLEAGIRSTVETLRWAPRDLYSWN